MKYIIWVIVILAVAFGVWKMIQTKPDANVPKAEVSDEAKESEENKKDDNSAQAPAFTEVDNANVKVAFKGFGPGKVHEGSFGKVKSDMYFVGGALAGNVSVETASLATTPDKLQTHLNSKDFFDTATYKTAKFEIVSYKDNTLTGKMTIRNITKTLSFPIKLEGGAYVADFTISMKEFGINQAFANDTFELIITAPVK